MCNISSESHTFLMVANLKKKATWSLEARFRLLYPPYEVRTGDTMV